MTQNTQQKPEPVEAIVETVFAEIKRRFDAELPGRYESDDQYRIKMMRKILVEELPKTNLDRITVSASGGGDEGCLDTITTVPEINIKMGWQDPAYSVLGDLLWETLENDCTNICNNEGGYGEIIIDLDTVPYTIEADFYHYEQTAVQATKFEEAL